MNGNIKLFNLLLPTNPYMFDPVLYAWRVKRPYGDYTVLTSDTKGKYFYCRTEDYYPIHRNTKKRNINSVTWRIVHMDCPVTHSQAEYLRNSHYSLA